MAYKTFTGTPRTMARDLGGIFREATERGVKEMDFSMIVKDCSSCFSLFIVKHEKNGLFMIVKDCLRLF